MRHKEKVIVIIHRLLSSSQCGPACSTTQCNRIGGKETSTNEHRKEALNQTKQCLSARNDTIVVGDFNQHIGSNEMETFFFAIGAEDAYARLNNVNVNALDKTYAHRSNRIDSIALSEGIMEYEEGTKLLEYNNIVFADHRAYLLDVNMEEYFDENSSL